MGGVTTTQTIAALKETTYERVMRTGEIHCGYTSWNPLFYIDPKTNEKLGIFHDLTEEIGKRLGVKIIWQEEIGWGSIVESVRNGRVDMACAGYWLNPGRIKNVLTSAPQLYSPLYVWMRQDDNRQFNNLDDLNSDQFSVAQIDGSAESQLIARRFQKTKVFSLPELNTSADEIESLITRKVDFIVMDGSSMGTYIANNPGKVKNILADRPLNDFPNVMLLPPDDWRFKDVVDNLLRNIEYDGTLDDILKKYQMETSFLRNPAPVRVTP